MMEQTRLEFVLVAEQPIAQHEESIGNSAVLMRRRVRKRDGSFCHVPIVTADAMRHGIREASSYAFLDAAGLLDAPDLSEAAMRLLFAGGMIAGSAGNSVSLDYYREMTNLVPTLGLLGGCAGNRMIPGRIWVDDAVLICEEAAHLLPAWIVGWMAERGDRFATERAHVEEVQRVRMDPSLDPGKRRLLAGPAEQEIQQRLLTGEQASETNDPIARDDARSSMMPRWFERISVGSLFHWSVTATTYSDLERDTFMVAVGSFLNSARVGGKRGTGHGLLRVEHGRQIAVTRPAEASVAIQLGGVGKLFREHVTARRDRIREFLGAVVA